MEKTSTVKTSKRKIRPRKGRKNGHGKNVHVSNVQGNTLIEKREMSIIQFIMSWLTARIAAAYHIRFNWSSTVVTRAWAPAGMARAGASIIGGNDARCVIEILGGGKEKIT